ncbi:MAG: translation initiation factor IF-3 [Thermodesulfovibrionales bacterium]|nr:translation initiation factor IF-3 [Thermodesulfovibrionales bacterium]
MTFIEKDIRVNEAIRRSEVRLIDVDGSQLGIVPIKEALAIARERGLDLVEVAPNANPPVCRIMDYGKYRYQMQKKSHQKKTIEVKEIKLRPRIDDHDLQLKAKSIRRFLDDGNKAKITMMLRGREATRPDLGMKVFEKLLQMIEGKYTVEKKATLEGSNITMVIAPGK